MSPRITFACMRSDLPFYDIPHWHNITKSKAIGSMRVSFGSEENVLTPSEI